LVNATTHCEKGFSCLKEGRGDCCQVVELDAKGNLYVECNKPVNAHCYYSYHVGKRPACTCPVRKELYLKYKL
jgi:hypothetical protein